MNLAERYKMENWDRDIELYMKLKKIIEEMKYPSIRAKNHLAQFHLKMIEHYGKEKMKGI